MYGCFASLSMTRWRIANLTLWSLSFNKERDVALRQGEVTLSPEHSPLCHSERSEESSSAWMLHFACASLSMTRWRIANLTLWSLSFNKERDVLAKAKTG